MATINATAIGLADWAARRDGDGKIPKIVEMLAQTNPILDDIVVKEGNMTTGHKSIIRTGLPTVAWRIANYGVAKSKSRTAPVTDNCGLLEGYSEVDEAIASLEDDLASFLLSEDQAFLESLSQEWASTLFYGNTATAPEEFMGLAPRYSSLSAASGANIINAAGAGADNTSIWFVVWGEQVFGMFPKGSMAGIEHNYLGKETVTDAAGGLYRAHRTQYKVNTGLVVKDWRQVARIANIDVSELLDAGESTFNGAELVLKMIDAFYKIKFPNAGKLMIYCNDAVATALHKLAKTDSNVNLTIDNYAGQPITKFLGYPIRRCDAILSTESVVS